MASLFGKHRLKSLASSIQTADIKDYVELIKTWHNDYHNGTLKVDKETSREQAYNRDFFLTILGYKEKPSNPYSFEPKATTEKGQLPDAVLSYTDTEQSLSNIAAVVELKGAGVDLDRPQRREGNMSPVQQGFKYKTQYRNCPFVVVSNFWEFRLYRDNLLDYEVWTLDDLVNPENDYFLFKTWFGLLKADHFIVPAGQSKTENLLSDIRIEQEEIGKKFYKIYREARLELLRDIYKNNPEVKANIDLGIEKAQKIIDRIVFACFAEDTGLLPDNTLQRVIKAAESSAFGGSLWNTLKGFFDAIDTGSPKLEIPGGYNGGLFKHDSELNNLKISDKALQSILSLSTYSFREDLSVTILGHIFEQSISDLEEIKNKVNESRNLETVSLSRRKKDGIFYTPDYIVRYIVDNSLGTYLREHEERYKDEFKLKGDINDENYIKRERQVYEKYQKFLENVKVLDPACGSGAFLVYVFDYLMAENKRVASILGNGLFSNDDYIRSILKNNIFGVDLNEESVEITKLSLWLKSAEKGKKLTSLDKNIKCGNSLIEENTVVGGKAFDWNSEFSEIMKSGGFDVIVGNPPYVRVQNISRNEVDYYFEKYKTPSGKLDLSIIFFEKALQLLRDGGIASYISSSQWMQTDYGKNIRDLLARGHLFEIVDFGSLPVFEGVDTYPAIFTLVKTNKTTFVHAVITDKELLNDSSIRAAERTTYDISTLGAEAWQFGQFDLIAKLRLLNKEFVLLSKIGKANIGDLTGMDEAFVLTRKEAEAAKLENEIVLPYAYRGAEIAKFSETLPESVVIYPYVRGETGESVLIEESVLQKKYPNIYSHLSKYKATLEKRMDSRKLYATGDKWYRHLRQGNFNYIEPKKLLFKGVAESPVVSMLGENTVFNGANCPAVIIDNAEYSPEYLLGIFNSNLVSAFLNSICPKKLGGYYRYNATNISRIPILKAPDSRIEDLSRSLVELYEKIQQSDVRFRSVVMQKLNLDKWPAKLERWWRNEFAEVASKLPSANSIQETDTLYGYFEQHKSTCASLEDQILKVESELNEQVNALYGLTDEEISLINK